ncbi:putative Queuine tRNA-ribosyltransferase-like protein [Amylocarpus encephaloides]|uniref:Queuine tRNA-ribosyltransferase accessory subunit 2 n=1 Tax=Amylocarpus encephaloides TaxID=45428 RepID=A0A9P8C1D9_9HELO|nr:putative Queuine tRNA-ribosyltransferase-like protein [Amylocarpus encephaloides]
MEIDGQELKSHSFKFDVLTALGPSTPAARLGKLSLTGRKDINTPNFFAVSSRGVVPHLTPDVISAHAQTGGIHMALEDFVERSRTSTPPIMDIHGSSPLHIFSALPSPFITLLAPRRTPAVAAPNGNTNTSITIFTSTGFQVLSNKAYINYISSLRPDIAISLADVPHGTTPGTKRRDKMADRTESWLSSLLASRTNAHTTIFAPILPIDANAQFEYFNHLEENATQIQGLALYDSNLLPDIPATTALSQLPRLSLDEPRSPNHILRQIGLGMDVFTIPFIGFATDAGIALTFEFSNSKQEDGGVEPLGVDMWSPTHSSSLMPLAVNCKCYACTSHHRAFIQHLLNAKEMLGWVLLQVHNHAILSQFFADIRRSIKEGWYEEGWKAFERKYDSEMPEKSGMGPRVRGYHYKSEGPREVKRNKAAWGNLGEVGPRKADVEMTVDSEVVVVSEDGAEELAKKRVAGKV